MMGRNIFFFSLLLLISFSRTFDPVEKARELFESDYTLKKLFTLQEAEKILGEKATLTDSSSVNKNGYSHFSVSFTALTMDTVSGKTGAVYVMFQSFKDTL